MKICIDLTSLYDKISGIEKYALSISKNLILNDNENYYHLIFKKEIHDEFKSLVKKNNVSTEIINFNNKLVLAQLLLPFYLYKSRCDLYVFLAFPAPILFRNKNTINAVHDMTPWMFPETMSKKGLLLFRRLIKKAMKNSKLVITVSRSSKDDILNYFNNDNIEVVYDGIDDRYLNYKDDSSIINKVIEKYKLPKEYILSLGTLEPRKNFQLLLDAYIELKSDGFISEKLVVVGRYGWKYDELLKKIDKYDLKNDVIFTGFVETEDLPIIYNKAKLFIFPSKYEGFGIPPLEAMAVGVPVIASNTASMPEVLGQSAIYFNNNDLADLKKKIIEFLNLNDEDKDGLIKNGKLHSMNFRWENEARKLLTLINDLDR